MNSLAARAKKANTMKANSPNRLSSVSDVVWCRAWQWLLVMVLGVAVQACGGSGGARPADAAPGMKDAAEDARSDVGFPSWQDTAVSYDSGSLDANEDAAAAGSDVGADAGAIDVLGQDVGVASLGDAMDVPPSNLKDTAVDQGLGTLDSAAEANPAIGTLDAMPTDMGDELSPASFSCGSLDGGLNTLDSGTVQRLCYDFSDSASAADFNPEAGTWVVSNGSYNASGPSEQVTCPGGVFAGSGMSASVLANLSALNVRVHAKMTSVTAPDKLLVLRSRPGGNRIELNFVANYTDNGVALGGVLNISELVDCVNTTYLSADSGNAVMIPHAIGQAIVVDVELVGSHLTVLVDGQKVYDDVVPVAIAAGSVGFAVFRGAETQYDDLVVEVLQ